MKLPNQGARRLTEREAKLIRDRETHTGEKWRVEKLRKEDLEGVVTEEDTQLCRKRSISSARKKHLRKNSAGALS